MRRNPNLEDCPERLKALLDVFADDRHTQQAILTDKLNFVLTEVTLQHRKGNLWRYLPPDYGEGLKGHCTDEDFVSAALEIVQFGEPSMETLSDIAEGLMSVGYLSHFAPPFFAQRIESVLRSPFYFIHFTSPRAAKRIAREGFKGRMRREDLQSTRHGQTDDSHAPLKLGTGYIYAYLLKATSADAVRAEIDAEGAFIRTDPDGDEAPMAAARSSAVVGRAQMGLLVFHKLDNEPQLLIPVECIEDASIVNLEVTSLPDEVDSFYESESEDDSYDEYDESESEYDSYDEYDESESEDD
jgi:hypothetical protein